MLNPFVWLLLLCIAMLISSFVAGCIPLTTKLSQSNLSFLTAVSAGLLISTSLAVIIPEGVETLYNSSRSETSTDLETDHQLEEHAVVGLCLLIGFAVMFVIDQFSAMHVHPSPSSAANANIDKRNSIELDAMLKTSRKTSDAVAASTSADNNTINMSEENNTSEHQPIQHLATPTVGLVVHAAADGIALGASVSDPQLSMVVFFAIMLHKAPSAFALTTVLLSEGLSRIHVRQHLLMFSLSAPTGALLTYLFLQFFSDAMDFVNVEYWTGALLLFSGGTFLYVAMHTIQESQHDNGSKTKRISCILLGMVIPFVLNLNHSH